MKIHWAKNPLETEVELDTPQEELLVKAQLRVDELKYVLGDIELAVEDNNKIEDVIENVFSVITRADDLVPAFRNSLMGSHLGDCVCIAASCIKCRTERFLGINTIRGLNKHAGDAIAGAFIKAKFETNDGHDYDLKKALDYLKNYNPETDSDIAKNLEKYSWYRKFFPEWKKASNEAYEWLKIYQERHYPDYDHVKEDLEKDLRLVYSL